MSRLRENSLYAKLEKCVFEQSLLPFLGYIISDSGLQTDPEKVSAVLNWSRPQGSKAIQRFLGFANYYRQFIPHFSTLVTSISALTRKGSNPHIWSSEEDDAFRSLKQAFASAPVLRRPEVNKPFILEVEWCWCSTFPKILFQTSGYLWFLFQNLLRLREELRHR
ncbi:uncharacterized protein LOC143798198 [Ranitomeya variabilis]|uniref:uncharacterized protein LOC143798198 n=1 Tax=Ranitomeya variabilis TaxID=490064 RepID=UPI0040566D32